MPITSAQVRGARAMLSLTQEQVANRAGLKRVAVARFETGITDPHESTLERIQTALERAGAIFIETDTGVGVIVKDNA